MRDVMIDQIGGEDALRDLVEAFYDLVETAPEGETLRKLHLRGQGIPHARVEQFNFLSGFLGGRAHYREKHGHMDVRRMHEHVPISAQDAEDWLALMDRALSDLGHHGPYTDRLRAAFRRVALMLVNDLGEWGVPASQPARATADRR